MIDIPTRVKDALREGDRLKRYRFVVYGVGYDIIHSFSSSEDTYTVVGDGDYQWHVDNVSGIIGEYERYSDGVTSGGDIINDDIIHLVDGDIISVYYYVVNPINLTIPIEVSEFTISNDNLVSESVTFDERMCSDKDIKFGLCEGTSLEFQYFGLPNITGKRLQAFIDVQYKDADSELKWYEIPMGWFEVKESSRQASTGIIKVSAFNKLLSDYLDAKANQLLNTISSDSVDGDGVSVFSFTNALLQNYSIEPKQQTSIIAIQSSGSGRFESGFSFKENGSNITYTHLYVIWDAYFCQLDVNKAILFEDLETYMEKLSVALNEFKDSVYANIQNPDSLWADFLPSFAYADFGISVFFGDARNENGWYTLENYGQSTGILKSLISIVDARRVMFKLPHDIRGITVDSQGYLDKETNWRWHGSGHLNPFMNLHVKQAEISDIEKTIIPYNAQDVTLRDLQTAVFEMNCQYGKLDRNTDLFSGVDLNNSRLLPAENLYPANDLYPMSMSERSNPSMYSKLWADEGNVRKFRYLIITYKGTEEDPESHQTREVEKVLQRTVNADGTDNYNMSNNWLFKNLVWTDEQIGDYADAMVEKMQNLTWFPFEMWCAGLPYIETGDEVEINVNGEAYTSYVLRRSLKGIQNLRDEMVNGVLDIF